MNPNEPVDARAAAPRADPRPQPEAVEPLHIDCAACAMQHTDACRDCVVTLICSREPDDAVIIGVDEARAIRMLGDVGLVPQLRHRRRTG